MTNYLQATVDSVNAAFGALSPSPLDPFKVAYAVGMAAAEREAKIKADAAKIEAAEVKENAKLAKKLGVYVNGVLRLQTRDHDAIYEYANRKMLEKANVWVAPVGSFVV